MKKITLLLTTVLVVSVLAGCKQAAPEESSAPLEPYIPEKTESVLEPYTGESSASSVNESPYLYLRPVTFEVDDTKLTAHILDSTENLVTKNTAYGERDGIRMDIFLDKRTPKEALDAELSFREATIKGLEGVQNYKCEQVGDDLVLSYEMPVETITAPCATYLCAERVRDGMTIVFVVNVDGRYVTDVTQDILPEVLEVIGLDQS